MKKIFMGFIALAMLCFTACTAEANKKVQNLETGQTCTYDYVDTAYFDFEPYFVESFSYDSVNKLYLIDYDNEDCFDYENLYELQDLEYNGESCVVLNTTKEIFFDILTNLKASPETLFDKYKIQEIFTLVGDDIIIYHKVVPNLEI